MNNTKEPFNRKFSAGFLALLLALVSVTLVAPTASAVGANQNDLGSNMDLPDNSTSINSSQAVMNMNGYAPMASGALYGELDVGDDEDWFSMTLNANEGVTLQIAYNTTYTSPNGSSYINDFELWIYDSSMNMIEYSINNNPEVVSTNASTGPHGGTVYFQIVRYSGYGSYTLDFWLFTTGSTSGNGTGGGNGTSPPSNCAGNGSLNPDILEPNDSTATATMASALPLSCTGLSIDSTTDVDYFELVLLTGVTYYVNVSFNSGNGDIDVGWDSATGNFIDSSTGTGSLESMTYFSSSNQTTYVDVYGWSSATNVYDIEISTDLPGGGQSFETISVEASSLTTSMVEVDGITSGTNYTIRTTTSQFFMNGSSVSGAATATNFTANGTTYNMTATVPSPTMVESDYCVTVELFDASGSLSFDSDCTYIEMLESSVLSTTTGSHSATNLTINTAYTLWWFVLDEVEFTNNLSVSNDINLALQASLVDEDMVNFTSTSTSQSWMVNWSGITTMNNHILVSVLYLPTSTLNFTTGDGYLGIHDDLFVPQLPTMVIDSFSSSSTSATNNVAVKGADLVVGDDYYYTVQVTDAAGANMASSGLLNFTATAQNMSQPTFTYSTPNMSGNYCAEVLLYSSAYVQLIGDRACFNLVLDDDNDGVANEYDLCPNTVAGAFVDQDGCALSQKDSDNDGYNDSVDAFPTDSTQHSDMDGDGFGDNPNGNSPDAFPTDSSQWSDYDGDGYGDNQEENATMSDTFPADGTQWNDTDGDGFGDEPTGTLADDCVSTAGTSWQNGTLGCPDADSDGWADQEDSFESDPTQWHDVDGDGYGDNIGGTNPDSCPTVWGNSTQTALGCPDYDGDGWADSIDALPADDTQYSDQDGDGYGDNFTSGAFQPDDCETVPGQSYRDVFGCLDSDLDGMSDTSDPCPWDPEIFEGRIGSVKCSITEDPNLENNVQSDSSNEGQSSVLIFLGIAIVALLSIIIVAQFSKTLAKSKSKKEKLEEIMVNDAFSEDEERRTAWIDYYVANGQLDEAKALGWVEQSTEELPQWKQFEIQQNQEQDEAIPTMVNLDDIL